MGTYLRAVSVFIVLFCFVIICHPNTVSDGDLFHDFIIKYNKPYEPGSAEYEARLTNFQKSLERHKKLNSLSKNQHDAFYGITKFADLTEVEFAEQVLAQPQHVFLTKPILNSSTSELQFYKHPKSYDLRNQKVVTSVKDQKECGGCWAFSMAETLETQYALKNKHLYTLSPQQMIDCSLGPMNHGCKGGSICYTAEWLNETKLKIVTEKTYPFIDKTSKECKQFKKSVGKVGITNYLCDGFVGKETQMVDQIVSHGPMSVAVDATSWQDYVGGIIQHHCFAHGDNHAVQIIGYDTTGPVPYFIVRNSWGKNWGLDGYLYIKIGGNLCGIANSVITVTV